MSVADLEIVERTNHYPVMHGWVYNECWVRLPNGRVELWAIRDHRLGSL